MAFIFTPNIVISGTNISVSTGDNIDYATLLNELISQPYFFDTMSVFANTTAQAGQILTKTYKTQAGERYETLEFPKVSPNQIQPVIEGVTLNFSPSPINKLKYNVLGGESVSLWFYYRHIPLFDYRSKNIDTPSPINKNEISNNMQMISVKKYITAPMFTLAVKHINKKTIKDSIKDHSKLRDITQISDEEVFKAFDDSDFKETV